MTDNFIPTAELMLQYTNGKLNKKLNELFIDLKTEIVKAANNGETWIYYDKHLPNAVIKRLQERGYTVRCAQDFNDVYYVIRWDNKYDDDE